jgi:hypothetical protein
VVAAVVVAETLLWPVGGCVLKRTVWLGPYPTNPPHLFLGSAVLYDDVLRQCRVWARLGHSAKEIQQELDARYDRIGDAVSRVETERREGASQPHRD